MGDSVSIATTTVGQRDSVSLRLLVAGYADLTVVGPAKAEVHLPGFSRLSMLDGGAKEDDEAPATVRKVSPNPVLVLSMR
jgi:hypothetical protein